jgi:hypothetical protein
LFRNRIDTRAAVQPHEPRLNTIAQHRMTNTTSAKA